MGYSVLSRVNHPILHPNQSQFVLFFQVGFEHGLQLFLAGIENLGQLGDFLSFLGDGFQVIQVFADGLSLALEGIRIGRTLTAMIAVDAVAVEPCREFGGLLRHLTQGFHVFQGGLQLFRCALGHQVDAVPQHVEGELDLLGPGPELLCSEVVQG